MLLCLWCQLVSSVRLWCHKHRWRPWTTPDNFSRYLFEQIPDSHHAADEKTHKVLCVKLVVDNFWREKKKEQMQLELTYKAYCCDLLANVYVCCWKEERKKGTTKQIWTVRNLINWAEYSGPSLLRGSLFTVLPFHNFFCAIEGMII